MSAIAIKSESKNDIQILSQLARKLSGNVINLSEEEFENLALGKLMDRVKTNKIVSRDKVMQKLRKQ